MPRNIPIQFRRGTSTEWENQNPVLIGGEPGFDTTNDIFKIGDGSTAWSGLVEFAPFNTSLVGGTGIVLNYIETSGILSIDSICLQNIIEDVTPQLGGNLDLNNYDIFGSGNINITGDVVAISGTLNQLIFNTGLDDPNLLAGQLQWNNTEGTLDLGLNETYAMHLGEELLYRVRNTTGSTLLAGQPVYASGLSPGANNRIEVGLYVADGTIREIRFMGLVTEDITDNGNNGFSTHFGYIRGIDTRGDAVTNGTTNKLWTTGEPEWYEGDILYVHPTVPGKLTKIEPKHSISIAIITSKGTNGKIFVRPTSYGHLDDNHDVDVSGVSNGQFLQYNSTTDYWVPSSSGNFTSLFVNDTEVSVTGHVHSTGDITDFASGVADIVSTSLVAGTGINLDYDIDADTVTIEADINSLFNANLVGGSGISLEYDNTIDTLTINSFQKNIAFFTPHANNPPSADYATIDTRNNIMVLDFDDGAVNESCIFIGVVPQNVSLASGLYVNIYWSATSATTGQCRWGVQIDKISNIDTDSYDTASEDNSPTNATNGVPTKTSILCTNIDSITNGDFYKIKIYRDSSDTTNDTMVGDSELIAVEIQTVI
jgi:hypothetical protein